MAAAIHIPRDAFEADTPGSATLGHAFLQERVAAYALCGFLLGLIFFAFRTIMSLATGRLSGSHPTFTYHAAGMSVYLVVWLIARRGHYRLLTIRVLDHSATFLCAILYGFMANYMPVGYRPDYILLVCLTYILVTRSTLVPSTAVRTAILAFFIGIILEIACYLGSAGVDLSDLPAYLQKELAPRTCVIRTGAWWLLTTTLAMMTSHVVYGLHREIHRVRHLGQYALEEKLGEGGMGVVYRASHATLRRPTAVKLLAPEKAGAVTIARFEREVRQTARLTHPNTVTIYDYGRTPEGLFYYAMELLEGATLEQLVEQCGPQPAARVVHIASQIASALCEAHLMGLIHRDVKPANVIISERHGVGDVAKVVDFGLVKELENAKVQLSQAGVVTGTPLYLAPEAITDPDKIDARVDLYALGALMYYLLAGENVFRAPSTMEVCAHHLHTPPAPIAERARLSPELAVLVMECLAKNPAQRPQSAESVLERLQSTPEAGTWIGRDAHAWWKANGDKLSNKRPRTPGSAQSTMAIDFQNRGGSASGRA
jgi:serine/threonine-protein kinase